MDIVTVSKADPITNNEPVGDATIIIKKSIPDLKKYSLARMSFFYRAEAKKIHKTLKKHLPQATLHQLLISMLEDHENLYRGI